MSHYFNQWLLSLYYFNQWLLSLHHFNTLRPRQNGRHFPDDTFKPIFLYENVRISIKISLKFVPKGPINNNPSLVQIMAWRRPGDKPLSEPMIVGLPMHMCFTRPQWVNQWLLSVHHSTNGCLVYMISTNGCLVYIILTNGCLVYIILTNGCLVCITWPEWVVILYCDLVYFIFLRYSIPTGAMAWHIYYHCLVVNI